ncbi:hypothetical protein G9F31_12745 [Acinetobacter sp. 187]|uniref:PepSY domain-containing protein n=1 Tax=Acinetobacter lanii TaxID=2715163 RepID=UPI00140BD344|nr:sulfite reductase flavoprotein subunit alpha [Acinetobacter lanii]NHC04614.1 hypothetical protein [Acinetobacter lanii]
MLKKTFFQIHWFLGITAGLILSLMGVTGAIYSYDQQILKLINPESYTVQAENTRKLSPAELYQHFHIHDPALKINSITVAASPTASSVVNIVKKGDKHGLNLMVNPYTAEKLPEIKGQEFFKFIKNLHRTLTVGPVGKQITGACTLILIFFALSGLYLRWPKVHTWKQWLSFKPQLQGRNFIWNLHAVAGTWVFVFYIVIASTGLTWSYSWWKNGMYTLMGVEKPLENKKNESARDPAEKHTEHGSAPTQHTQRSDHAGNAVISDSIAAKKPREDRTEKSDALSPVEIHRALNQTWLGFNAQMGREYSTLTLNLPKKDDGKVEVSFVDVIPQHERARNKAVYNYQSAQIEKMELYADKKLNKKVMSSILPVHRGSFFGPLYQFFAMLSALSMPLFFVTGWMLYLKRRKQKQLTLAEKQKGLMSEVDPDATPWLITYATQTGVSEQLAWGTASSLQEAQQSVTVKPIQKLTLSDLQKFEKVLFIASTYGTGEAPDLASSFSKNIMSQSLDLSHLKFAVLALGSMDYPETFCFFGHYLHRWLEENQATALFETIEVDNSNAKAIQLWNEKLATVSQLKLKSSNIEHTFDQWTLTQRTLLNPNSLGAPAFNLELQAQHEAQWQAGDIAIVQPGNSLERIQAFLDQHQIDADAHVDSLNQNIQHALWNKNLASDIESVTNLDLLVNQLPDLPIREYSIASIPTQQVLRLVVRQKMDNSGELGLGSGWLTHHTQLRDKIHLRIRTNPNFHLIDDNRPIICIGNGTGIAGLLSLMSARIRQGYTENWLIFGERQQAHDFFYKETIQAWQNTAMLKRCDLAFSRDQAEKIYVHHKLREQADELKSWIEQGAVIYVCGSIQGMASDVDATLIEILGADVVDQLRHDGRYRRDVY